MTDNEIIKALEVHGNEKFDNCEGCPYLDGDSCEGFPKYSKPYRNVLDLINRQKAEIERLKNQIKAGDKIYEDHMLKMEAEKDNLKQEIERLLPFGCQVEVSDKIEQEIKSEAYREFAEQLEHAEYGQIDSEYATIIYTQDDIDNALKELTGGE